MKKQLTRLQCESRWHQGVVHSVCCINRCAARVDVHKAYEMRLGVLLLLLLLLSMLLTTGCSGQEELPVTSAGFPERSSVAQKQSEIIMSSSFYSPFPDDKIRFDFPFHLKADRFYETGTPPVAQIGRAHV